MRKTKSTFQGFRARIADLVKNKRAKKKRVHYKDTVKGRSVSEVKAKVRDSDLLRYANGLAMSGNLQMYSIRAPYIYSTYNSIKNNLNNDYVIKRTAWAKYINWDDYRRALREWCRTYLEPGLVKTYENYWDTKTKYGLSPYEAPKLIDSLNMYGYNSGRWDTEATKKWIFEARDMYSEIKWTDMNLHDVSSKYQEYEEADAAEAWNELCIECPMFGLLRHDATSSWPDYHKQTIYYILQTYWQAINSAPQGVVTMYHRRHGITLVIDKRGVGSTVIKVRFVGGVEYVIKIHGLYITWSFKESRPEWTLYYKDWGPEFRSLTEFIEGFDGKVFTADRTMHDAHHDKSLLDKHKILVTENMPDHIKKSYVMIHEAGFDDPTILISPFDAIKLGRSIATSGNVPIPLIESVTSGAGQRCAIEDQGCEVKFERVQIDDTFYATDAKFDIDKMAQFVGSHFGEDINPAKTEVLDKTNLVDKKFVVLLQIAVGELYLNPKDLTFMVDTTTDRTFYHGFIPRRDHREEKRERIRVGMTGDIRWKQVEIDMPKDKLINVQRMIGTVSSMGEQCPVELLDLKLDFLSSNRFKRDALNPIFEDVIEYAKCDPEYDVEDFGFSPGFVLKRINERW